MELYKDNLKTVEDVIEVFKSGLDCGQAVTYAIAMDLGIDPEKAVQAAAAFGGGNFEGGICGAYVGGLIAVGMKYGHYKAGNPESKVDLIKKVHEFKEKYKEIAASETCREILGADLTTEEGSKIINEKNLLMTVCPKLTMDVINIVRSL